MLLLSACAGGGPRQSLPGEEWERATPESQGLDSEALASLIESIKASGLNLHSLIIVRNGYLVTEAAFYPFQPGYVHELASATKSVTSLLVGAAIEDGLIASVDTPVLEIDPGLAPSDGDPDKDAITVKHLLTHTSGLEWGNSLNPFTDTTAQMNRAPDWSQFVLDQRLAAEPGSTFVYSNGGTHVLSELVGAVTGEPMGDYARTRLFDPIGVGEVFWPQDPLDVTFGAGGLQMDPLDMARLGLLVLNEGRWGNEQVIPAEWIEASTVGHVATPDDAPYGYLWWIKPYGVAAAGAGGQFIVVMPDLDMVVVITSGLTLEDFQMIDGLVLDGIRPAAAEDRLPENAAGQARLEEALASAGNAPLPILIALPEVAASVDGQRYLMQPNSLLWRGFSLDFSIDEASGGGMASIDIFIGRQQNDSVVKLNVPLDGSWALNDGGALTPLGVPVAARGRWELDGSFLLEVQALNAAERYQHRFEFSGDTVIMTVNGLVAGQYGIIPGQSGQ